MKKAKSLLTLSIALFLSSCHAERGLFSADGSRVKVVFEDNDRIKMDHKIYEVEKGSNLTVFLDYEEGFTFSNINYAASDYTIDDSQDVTLTLYDIKYPLRLSIENKPFGILISYHPNGGSFLDNSQKDHQNVIDPLIHHQRPNVSIGTDLFRRDGYIQVGWNTEKDGKGTHVGLGSRITPEGNRMDLYAEWVKTTRASYFGFEENGNGISITAYNGPKSMDTLCIPERIGDYKVTKLSSGLFWGLSFRHIVLPPSLEEISSKCFSDMEIETLTFFDSLREVEDSSFENCRIKTLDIQAHMAPRFLSGYDNARFSENIDNLILSQGKKKMVFFAGCSMSYGLKSELVQREFPDYKVINCGVIGGIVATFQMDIIAHYLEKGDIFIHAPEEMSNYQLLHDYDFAMRVFVLMESNYDLLHLTNLSQNTKIFSSFREFNALRYKLISQSYDDFNGNYNDFGDISITRPNAPSDSFFDLEECFALSSLDDRTQKNLSGYYQYLKEKGVTPFFSYAPLNRNAIEKVGGSISAGKEYVSFMEKSLGKQIIISSLDDYILPGNYFFDKDYHLSDEGAIVRTNTLIQDIQKGIHRNETSDNL